MKQRHGFPIILAILLVLSFITPLQAGVPAAQTEPVPSSAIAPPGYSPTHGAMKSESQTQTAQAAAEGDADILLIQTAIPWQSTADTQVLNSLGYSYDIVDMSSIGSVDLFSYPVILIVNDQVQSFYDQYATQVAAFESYVSSGGVLVFFAASDGWANGTLRANLPGGVHLNTPSYQYNCYIADATHPIISGVLSSGVPLTNADLYSNYCSHGYFTSLVPSSRTILKDATERPTLIEYTLGKGRVIASTQTWEHNWAYHTGSDGYGTFARKALDDVFLYAFSGGSIPADITVELRIDDAPRWLNVNKSRGSYVDVVARVSGDAAYQASLVLQVPGDKLGKPTKTLVRNRSYEVGQDAQYEDLGAGQYRTTATLQQLGSKFVREIIWRFKVPDNATAEKGLNLAGTLTVAGRIVPKPTSTARLNIVSSATAIIVTNRTRLYSKFPPSVFGTDQTELLLQAIHEQGYIIDGEVFYADLYNDAVRDWNQSVDYSSETKANAVATALDSLIEGWYNKLSNPLFLLLVGGDEVVPFWRIDDRDYGDEEKEVTVDNDDPVGKVPHENYFLSDSPYADVGGGKSDWETGKLELATGRVLGDSAKAMRNFMTNASLKTPALDDAVVASRSDAHELPTVRERLNIIFVSVYGDSTPDLTENDQWTRAQWITALQQEFQVLGYQGHGRFDGWYGTDRWTQGLKASDSDYPAGRVAANHPLFVVAACNFAIPTDLNGTTWKPEVNDNISYKLISLGAGGIAAPTALHYPAPKGVINLGERVYNDYFGQLLDGTSESAFFGMALLRAKQQYPGSGANGSYTALDKKSLMEYVYYGLPWSFMETPNHEAPPPPPAVATAPMTLARSQAEFAADVLQLRSKALSFAVTSHQFEPIADPAGFELLKIPGADNSYAYHEPVLPLLRATVNLPLGASVTGVELVSEHAVSLGAHNIPAADPSNEFDPGSGFTSVMDVSGVYPPAPRYSYETVNMGDHVEVRVTVAPATLNIDTHELTLYDSTVLNISYSAEGSVLISDMKLNKHQYQVDESVAVSATIENTAATSLDLTATATVYDSVGNIAAVTSSPFTVGSAASHGLHLNILAPAEPGGYRIDLTVHDNGVDQASSIASFNVLAGKITVFNAPAILSHGEYGTVDLSFANYRPAPVSAVAKVHIYDDLGLEAASLLERTFTVASDGVGAAAWAWDASAVPAGQYVARAVVQVGTETYLSDPVEIQIVDQNNLPPTANAGGPYSVPEGGSVTLTGTGSDPDGDALTYAWDLDNDGTFETPGQSVIFSAVGRDGPDSQAVVLQVCDTAPECATSSTTVTITNVAPQVSNDRPAQNVQYSDPIAAVTVSATDLTGDLPLSASTSWTVDGGAVQTGLPLGLTLTAGDCTPSDGTTTCVWSLAGKPMVAPGVYVVTVSVSDHDGDAGSTDITITVAPEDARVTYTGALYVSTSGTTSTAAKMTLAATIQDITTVDSVADPDFGDIRNATVAFVNRDTGATLCTAAIGLVDLADTKTGTATCNWDVAITGDSQSFTIGIVVGGYYNRDASADNTIVTVAKPLASSFISGGGYLLLTDSAGQKAGDDGAKNNFGFSVKYNKSGKNLQGNINIILRRTELDGVLHTYQIKGNVLTSLSVKPANGTAVFNGKANIKDITDPLYPITVDANATLQVTMTDRGEPGTSDSIGITVWNKTGGLWFASKWDGTKTVEDTLAGGNLVVR